VSNSIIERNPRYQEAKNNFIVADANFNDNPRSNRFIKEYNNALDRVQEIIKELKGKK